MVESRKKSIYCEETTDLDSQGLGWKFEYSKIFYPADQERVDMDMDEKLVVENTFRNRLGTRGYGDRGYNSSWDVIIVKDGKLRTRVADEFGYSRALEHLEEMDSGVRASILEKMCGEARDLLKRGVVHYAEIKNSGDF